jgi:uridylate kinase
MSDWLVSPRKHCERVLVLLTLCMNCTRVNHVYSHDAELDLSFTVFDKMIYEHASNDRLVAINTNNKN